jgi:hypothetical protein
MLVVFALLLLCLVAAVILTVVWEDLVDDGVILIPLVLGGAAFLVLLFSSAYRPWALTSVGLFVTLAALALVVRWNATVHGRLERGYWRRNTRDILGSLFRKYSLNERKNEAITRDLENHLTEILPEEWRDVIAAASRELMAVKVTADRVRSLGISPATAGSYARTTVSAGDALWRVTERVAAVYADGYFSPVVRDRLEAERHKVENLIGAAGSAREALAQLTLGDTGGGELEGAELQLRALTEATRELEIV